MSPWRVPLFAVATALMLTMLGAAASNASAVAPVPEGFTVAEQKTLSPGVTHTRLVRFEPAPLVVNVARVAADAGLELRAVLSNNDVNGGLERPSEMCRRVDCVVAVNGDFHHVDTEQPVGGLVSGGEMMRSPVASHHQLTFTPAGPVSSGQLTWSGTLMPSDLQEVALTDVNRPRSDGALVLYTPAYGASTATNPHGAEMVLRSADATRLGETVLVEMVAFRDGAGDTAIARDGLVLSGHGEGAATLRDLWARVQAGHAGATAMLRLDADTDATDSMGGSPVLVRNGQSFVGNDGSAFVAGRHPRTIVGWTAEREVLLVTIDGRQPGYSVGASLLDAASLLVELGAVEALNLDGGGSTTFATAGAVLNQPSDRVVRRAGAERIAHSTQPSDEVVGHVERPVSVALAVMAAARPAAVTGDPLGDAPGAPSARPSYRELALGVPTSDPASDPTGALPALVTSVPEERERNAAPMLSAVAAALVVAVGGRLVREAKRSLA